MNCLNKHLLNWISAILGEEKQITKTSYEQKIIIVSYDSYYEKKG